MTMTKYTRKELAANAAYIAKEIRKETGHPSKVKDWSIYIDGSNTCLAVLVACYDGIRQRNMAI